jgi:hypothetical protein
MRIYHSLTHTDVSIGCSKHVCSSKLPIILFSLPTSLDILKNIIAHKRSDKHLTWIQTPVVQTTHKICAKETW